MLIIIYRKWLSVQSTIDLYDPVGYIMSRTHYSTSLDIRLEQLFVSIWQYLEIPSHCPNQPAHSHTPLLSKQNSHEEIVSSINVCDRERERQSVLLLYQCYSLKLVTICRHWHLYYASYWSRQKLQWGWGGPVLRGDLSCLGHSSGGLPWVTTATAEMFK